MHDQRRLLEDRLTRFVAEHLRPAVYRARQQVQLSWWVAPGEPVPFDRAAGLKKQMRAICALLVFHNPFRKLSLPHSGD